MNPIHPCLIIAATIAAFPAAAQVQWYGLAAGGAARTNIDQVRSVESGFGPTNSLQTSFDDRGAAWKLSAGLRFNRGVALELTYADLGRTSTFTGGASASAFTTLFGLTVDRKVHGLGLDLVGSIPVIPSRLDLIAKLGAYRTTITADVAIENFIPPLAGSTRRSSRDTGKEDITHVGLGLQAHITPRWALRAEYERFLSVGNPFVLGDPNGTGRSDIDVAWIGVAYSF